MARHACMGGTSGCGWCVWPLVPPTTLVVPVVPVSVVLVSMSPPLFPLTHTQAWHTTTPHTHTAGGWSTLVPGVCVCVGTVLAVAAPGSPLTPPPTPSAPLHSTSPLAAAAGGGGGCGGGSVGVVACVATWSTHWLCWCCPLPHPHTHTHTGWWARGGGGCVCGVAATTTVRHSHQPPSLCPLPRPVRCACVRVSGGTRHSGALWWHARWCVAERAPCPPHPPPTLSTLVRSLSSRSPSLTSHTHTQMARLTPHTHMAWFVWLHPCTTASEHTPWCTALALTTTCVLLVCVVVCTSTHSFFFHSHTQRGKWFVVSCCSKVSPERERTNTHTRPLPFLSFSLSTLFNGASGGTHCPSPPLSTLLSIPFHRSVHANE